jgi:hypothetical protein
VPPARRTALEKKPRKRPSATLLLEHPWIVKNMAHAVAAPTPRRTIEQLLEPIPIYRVPGSGGEAGSHSETICFTPRGSDATGDSTDLGASRGTREASAVSQRLDAVARGAGTAVAPHDPMRALRAEFGGDVGAPTGAVGGVTAESPTSGLSRGVGALSFTVPAKQYTGVAVQQLSKEEKGETGAAVGMKARVQLYMTRQRM